MRHLRLSIDATDLRLVAMRLQHVKQAASGLSTYEPRRTRAKTAIVAEVERLHWQIWNGKARDAQLTLERIRKVMHAFRGERGHRRMGMPSCKLWRVLHEVDDYRRRLGGPSCASAGGVFPRVRNGQGKVQLGLATGMLAW